MKRSPNTIITALALTSWAATGLQAGFLLNPSFEANYPETWPHYGSVDEWTGGSGTNKSDGPFHNNGTPVPDLEQMAFMQGADRNLSQDISGLVVGKKYWIQFYYDSRACCGGTIDLLTFIDDQQLDNITNVKPTTAENGYYFRSVPFTAKAATATLAFKTAGSGDATVLVDAVTIVQRDDGNVVVANPSFEASGVVPAPGTLEALAGWQISGKVGVKAGEAGNGKVPDQDNVAFIQGAGAITQKLVGLVKGTNYQFVVAYNAGKGTVPHIQFKVDNKVVAEEDVTEVGGAAAYKTKTVSFTAAEAAATISIAQTKTGNETLLVDDIKLLGQTGKELDPLKLTPASAEMAVGDVLDFVVTIPKEAIASKDLTVVLGTNNGNALAFPDGSGGLARRVNVTFAKGGPNEKTVKVQALARGSAIIQVADAGGLKISNQPGVVVTAAFLKNPSFESTPAPGGVGYGQIAGWTGGSGINTKDQPFADNSEIPDRGQVGFIQGAAKLSQQVRGLTPGKNYWLQFFYNVRNCCGAGFGMDATVTLGGKELSSIKGIKPAADAPYHFHHVEFVAESANALLEISTTPTGDATLLVDGFSIVQRDKGQIILANPSFEASGSVYPFPGYFPSIAGWAVSGGGRGVNIDGAGPFTDNGRGGDQDLVLFMQGNGSSVTQTLRGLTRGSKYTVALLVNGRRCCGNEDTEYEVTVDDNKILGEAFQPVGEANLYYVKQATFTAGGAEAVLTIKGTTPAGDHTLLVDNVHVFAENFRPVILAQPRTVSAEVGGSATMSVAAVGAGLSFQWKRNGQAIAGQTKDTLTLNSLTEAQGGDITVEVKNAGGATETSPVKLNVLQGIPGVFDTGVNNNKKLLNSGDVDTHYVLVTNPDDTTSTKTYAEDDQVFPIVAGPWIANSEVSRWIGPRPDPNGHAAGDYIYRLSLDLTNYDPKTVVLQGQWSADNTVELHINGAYTGLNFAGFGGFGNFSISGVFKAGINQIDFKLINGGPDANPSGLRIEGMTAIGAKTGGGPVTPTVAPSLAISRLGSQARLAWPTANATGYVLEASADLKTWAPAGLATAAEGANTTAAAPIAGARYFRLKK